MSAKWHGCVRVKPHFGTEAGQHATTMSYVRVKPRYDIEADNTIPPRRACSLSFAIIPGQTTLQLRYRYTFKASANEAGICHSNLVLTTKLVTLHLSL